ncbi:MAG: hypothetical protein KKF68_01660 [Nanoarchaeota archaeon]|nr:hypothetical protein [Nanoarchaeota archaeon]
MGENRSFGMLEQKHRYQRYHDKWVIIYILNNTFAGKVSELGEDYIILNPFSGGVYDKEKGLTRKLIGGESMIFLPQIIAIEPTTQEDIKNSCDHHNKPKE